MALTKGLALSLSGRVHGLVHGKKERFGQNILQPLEVSEIRFLVKQTIFDTLLVTPHKMDWFKNVLTIISQLFGEILWVNKSLELVRCM